MKQTFLGKLHKTLDNVSEIIRNEVTILTDEQMKLICNFEYIFYSQY